MISFISTKACFPLYLCIEHLLCTKYCDMVSPSRNSVSRGRQASKLVMMTHCENGHGHPRMRHRENAKEGRFFQTKEVRGSLVEEDRWELGAVEGGERVWF